MISNDNLIISKVAKVSEKEAEKRFSPPTRDMTAETISTNEGEVEVDTEFFVNFTICVGF